ncbi:MAG: NAD(P)/FAD-dependent oxidoreductase [Firmicutes bacterium]|nr:NAD(P)/FAD-dependent oxidoreductase [Bacillota bacterium]
MRTYYDVVIIGAGPAGFFTALELVRNSSDLSILLVDKGRSLAQRFCVARKTGVCASCDPCAITSGFAGAGAFSDGKLSLAPSVGGRLTDYLSAKTVQNLIDYVDGIYREFGASDAVHGLNDKAVEDIMYEASKHNIQLIPCPVRHLGTDESLEILENMYQYLVKQPNFEFSELTTVLEILADNGRATGVRLQRKGKEPVEVKARYVIAAPGRGGASWMLEESRRLGLKTENNEVDIGVRVEVPNAIIDHLTRELYEAKLVYYSDTFDNKVRTFCMNPGGVVSEERYEGDLAVVNGHSYQDPRLRTPNTNFALLVSTRFTEPFKEPIEYGKYIARLANMLTGGGVMIQRLGDLLKGRRTDKDRLKKSTTIPTLPSAVPGDLSYALPHRYLMSIVETLRALDNIIPGLYSRNTLLYGVEVKFYSARVDVKPNMATEIEGLYAIGDGAGVTRGLIQASASGVIVARDILDLPLPEGTWQGT